MGNKKKRIDALYADADIYVINRENVAWLVDFLHRRWPFPIVVIDELSSFKSQSSKRWRALRSVRKQMRRVIGLTGTPRPNGIDDLWAEIYLLDGGTRLGNTITACRTLDKPEDIDDWNAGNIPVAIAHPASVGHGLNLQDGGHIIIWFGLTWSLELYQQANERLNRPGQKSVCRIYHILLKGTYDERVLRALERKEHGQTEALNALKYDILKGGGTP